MKKLHKIKCFLLSVCFLICIRAGAHALPNTSAEIFVHSNSVLIQFKTPVDIVELASKLHIDLQVLASKDSLRKYYLQHIAVNDSLYSSWQVAIDTLYINHTSNKIVGNYDEIVAAVYLTPSNPKSLDDFFLNCDLVVHQVVNQSILFSARQQAQKEDSTSASIQVGTISVDYASGKILPIEVKLNRTSLLMSFKNMMQLGMEHIKAGTDHLLFLLVLLLPAPLFINGKRWGNFGGIKYSITRLVKIITAFTIGHSITLLIGALGWLHLPPQPVEILIAFSIFISAIHAVYPIFPGKEIFVAGGFGLIHGLAFASVIANLNLSGGAMALSILGFNVGIEIMQLFVVAIIVPWLILLSKTALYKWVRIIGAVLAATAAIAWIAERSSGEGNIITSCLAGINTSVNRYIIVLALISISAHTMQKIKLKRTGHV